MATKKYNAFDINKIICQKVLHEHDVEASKFAFEIARISVQLKKMSDGEFKYNEDCYVFDITTNDELENVYKRLDEVLRDYPYVIYEYEDKPYLAVCPYDQVGISIEKDIDAVYEIIDA